MKATELHLADGRTAGIFFCSECRNVKRTKDEAEQCCQPVTCKCGATVKEKYWLICDKCRDDREREKELDKFQKAEKVTQWDGWIYADGFGCNEGYFDSVDELLEAIEESLDDPDMPEPPEYAWTCDERQICRLDYDTIIEAATEESYEDWSPDQLTGSEELKAALDKFNEANKGEVYYVPNFKRALLLSKSNTEVSGGYRKEKL